MSVQRPADVDLEATAELPVLDVAAFENAENSEGRLSQTDTWRAPDQAQPNTGLDDERGAPSEDPNHLRADLEVAAENRSRLADELRTVSERLRELESRLTKKTERLSTLEREIEAVRSERQAAEARIALQVSAAETARAVVAAASSRAEMAERALNEREGILAQSLARAGALEAEVEQLKRQTEARRVELERAHEDALESRRVLDARDTALAHRERDLSAARIETDELRGRVSKYFEALQSLEGRRGIYEQMMTELEHEIAGRDARIVENDKELASRADRIHAIEATLAARDEQIASLGRERTSASESINLLTSELAALKPLNARVASLEGELRAARAERNQRDERISALLVEVDTLKPVAHRVSALQTDLTAAHAECRARDVRIGALVSELAALTQVAQRVSGLDADLAAARSEHERHARARAAELVASESLKQDLEARLVEAHARVKVLEAELQRNLAALAERTAAAQTVEAILEERKGRDSTVTQRLRDLEAQIAEQDQALRVWHEELIKAREIASDLRTAQDTIHRLEAELRTNTSKLEEQVLARETWRSKAEEARAKIEAQAALIRRYEADAVSNAAELGNIHRSMERLDPLAASINELGIESAARLLIRTDGESEVLHVLGRRTTIGRTPDNDLQIDARFISRHHAVILAARDYTIVEDLNSTNGVQVNDRRVTRQTLNDGDVLTIGKTRIRFAVRSRSPRPQPT